MKHVRVTLTGTERQTNAAYNKVFRCLPSKELSRGEYQPEDSDGGVYIVELDIQPDYVVSEINDIPRVKAEIVEMPDEIQAILDTFEDETYTECRRIEAEISVYGWAMDWGLDASPYNIRKMNREDLVQLWLDAEEENRKHTEEGNTKCLALKDAFSTIYSTLSIEEQKDMDEELDSYGA